MTHLVQLRSSRLKPVQTRMYSSKHDKKESECNNTESDIVNELRYLRIMKHLAQITCVFLFINYLFASSKAKGEEKAADEMRSMLDDISRRSPSQ